MDSTYLRQAELVVRCIPAIAAEPCFAIKGGTAINLFELNLPRLSVDIDLTFLPLTDRATIERLAVDVTGLFDDGDKQRLLDFVSLSGEENAWGIPHFNELPAIRWKRRNLESLRKSNPKKFMVQREALERLFEEETLP